MRPAVLIVDPDADRRRALSEGLARFGYDSVPAVTAEEGARFARGLEPGLIIASAELAGFGDGAVLETFSVAGRRTLVLIGEGPAESWDLAEDVRYLSSRGLAHDELLRRVRLVLVGREIGVEADFELSFLVGDLSLQPLLELIRSVHAARVTGRLDLPRGDIAFVDGEVVAARSAGCRGLKAFLRLGRLQDGPFRLELGHGGQGREIDLEVPDLVLRALEESQIELPDPRTRLRVLPANGPDPSTSSELAALLDAIAESPTVGALMDSLPASDGSIARTLETLVAHGLVRMEKARAAVTVVTDSTCDLPADLARSHDLVVAPLGIVFGEATFRDGVDLTARDFYELLASGDEHPQTRPPSEAELFEVFCGLIEDQDVVAVHISGKLSKTLDNARQAALRGIRGFDHLPPERHGFALEVVDSETVSVGTGLLALAASRMAHRGLTVFEITQRLRELSPRIGVLFVVETLDYLVKGGRVGRAQALVGKLLGIRPILGITDGEVAPLERVRGGKAYPRLVELAGYGLDPGKPILAGVAHAQAPASADRLRTMLEERYEVREMIVTDIGPVVGTHAGPGCVGCAVLQPTDDEWDLLGALE